jgi:hypothetical protein
MLASRPESLTNEEPISIFNRWPKDWDAAFSQLARGAFVVSSAQKGGKVPLVEILSQAGGPCRLVNPWGGGDVTLYRNSRKAEDLSGETLAFPTAKGETIVLAPKGSTPAAVKMP